ncbi:hypothetical protein BDB00DRAFT_640217 [Zychaea mexicana]|uniref:uncharacterized protein n=1 Tax=Zychaea mexicana TaxID=64656 RepID=UPI0022FF04CC|nr:uncharacterized protein BDB00DRAFT_640217 [Zychaea mexicana]KAI9489034.1 hypothetical protein BDB00DRAFT_640217 [Zychaea mexicana]
MLEKWDDSFAKTQLEKYGWKNGEGLGKDKHGNAKHIAVKVKNDTKGVGKNQEQWDFAWWDHLYNKSASSVSVEKDPEGSEIRIATKKKSENRKSETGILSTYRPTANSRGTKESSAPSSPASSMSAVADQANLMDSVKQVHSSMAQTIARSSLYSGFVKSAATLVPSDETATPKSSSTSSSNTSSDNDDDDDDDDGKDYSMKMTDAELFAACEGRTARKGGLGLVEQKGKYARVMQDYLAHDKSKDDVKDDSKKRKRDNDTKVEMKKKTKGEDGEEKEKKKKKKSKDDGEDKKKDKKKKKKSKESNEKKDKKKKKKEKKSD